MPLSRMTDGQAVEFPPSISKWFLATLAGNMRGHVCLWCGISANTSSFACIAVMHGTDGDADADNSPLFVACTVSCDFCGTYAKISVIDSPFGSGFGFGHEEQ